MHRILLAVLLAMIAPRPAAALLNGYTLNPNTAAQLSSVTINCGSSSSTCFSVGAGTLTVTKAGNVGIGTSVPAFKLHMSSGILRVDGNGATIAVGPTNQGGALSADAGSSNNTAVVIRGKVSIGGNSAGDLDVTNQGTVSNVVANLKGGAGQTGDILDISSSGGTGDLLSISSSGNVKISTGAGIVAGNSTSTMTPVGDLFFASTATISGSTRTFGGATVVAHATFTLTANTLGVGDTLVVECGYLNGASAPTAPVLRPALDLGGANNGAFATFTTNVATANQQTTAIIRLRIKPNKTASYMARAESAIFNANGLYPVPTDGATAGSPSNLFYDPTVSHTIICSASDNGGGPVNFDYMKVRKE